MTDSSRRNEVKADLVKRLRAPPLAERNEGIKIEAADEIERLRVERNISISTASALALDAAGKDAEIERLRELVDRADNLARSVFKAATKADHERNRHNAAQLCNAIARERNWGGVLSS